MIRRIVATVSFLVAALCIVTPANAAEVPEAWCSSYDPALCYTQSATDAHSTERTTVGASYFIYVKDSTSVRSFTSTGCSAVNIYGQSNPTRNSTTCTKIPGYYVTHRFKRYHKYRPRYNYLDATYHLFVADDGITTDASSRMAPGVLYYANFDSADCYDATSNPVTQDANAQYVFTAAAQQDFKDACAGKVKEPGTTKPAPITITPPSTDTTTMCPVVTVGAKKTKIVTVNLPCLTGRTVMAKYLKTGREPSGFVCVSAKLGRNKIGKCVKEGSGRAKRPTVTGTYRYR